MDRSFELGTVVITRAAERQIYHPDIDEALARHARGDWGNLDPEDVAENEFSLQMGLRILSSYEDRLGNKFWIITEADRSYTTILLPEDY